MERDAHLPFLDNIQLLAVVALAEDSVAWRNLPDFALRSKLKQFIIVQAAKNMDTAQAFYGLLVHRAYPFYCGSHRYATSQYSILSVRRIGLFGRGESGLY
jgi:hypothetical protein